MPIKAIHSFLVHPAKNINEADAPKIGGTCVALGEGRLVGMLQEIYRRAESECKIDISFNPATNGNQQNDCRDLIVSYAEKSQIEDGRALATRLQRVTTWKSGLGLLFFIVGVEDEDQTKLVISRFRADNGILAAQDESSLSVEFLERVFMKRATSYKAVMYIDKSFSAGFWEGRAIDKQNDSDSSEYWIKDFLASDFRTTSAAGTRRLADALRNAVTKAKTVEVKGNLIAAAQLARGLEGQSTSIAGILDRFGLSGEARESVEQEVEPHLRTESFRLNVAVLDEHAPLRSIELDNGAVLIAPTSRFDNIFRTEKLPSGDKDRVRITTEGRIIDERLRKRK
jgi:hypothetical protein